MSVLLLVFRKGAGFVLLLLCWVFSLMNDIRNTQSGKCLIVDQSILSKVGGYSAHYRIVQLPESRSTVILPVSLCSCLPPRCFFKLNEKCPAGLEVLQFNITYDAFISVEGVQLLDRIDCE